MLGIVFFFFFHYSIASRELLTFLHSYKTTQCNKSVTFYRSIFFITFKWQHASL